MRLDTGLPLALEQDLPVGHHRAGHLHHQLVPATGRLLRQPEVVGGPRTADPGQRLIDQQQLAMVAVHVAHPAPPADRVVQAQLHAGAAQLPAQPRAEALAAEGIEQAAHLHPALRGTTETIDQMAGAATRLGQIQLQLDLAAGRIDGGSHPGKELLAIDQQLETVASAPGKDGLGHGAEAIQGREVAGLGIESSCGNEFPAP
ncbi:hypothetical protein D3C81_981630 [compost metagenome]